jgi:hypothetical protein
MNMAAHLRLYPSSTDESRDESTRPTIRVRFGDLLPLVALAQKKNYLWLQDFQDDEVRVTSDLYEILRAFRSYRPSA